MMIKRWIKKIRLALELADIIGDVHQDAEISKLDDTNALWLVYHDTPDGSWPLMTLSRLTDPPRAFPGDQLEFTIKAGYGKAKYFVEK